MPSIQTPTGEHRDMIRELVLSELPKLRLNRDSVEAALTSGSEARIPSRKAMVVIARVCKGLGLSRAVKKADLKPDQVTSVANLIELLASRTQPELAIA